MKARTDSMGVQADSSRAQSVRVNNQARDLATEIRDLRLKSKAITAYVVKPGDTLRKISSVVYGDPLYWKGIYEANKSLIGAEDAELKAGTRLAIPAKGTTVMNPGAGAKPGAATPAGSRPTASG